MMLQESITSLFAMVLTRSSPRETLRRTLLKSWLLSTLLVSLTLRMFLMTRRSSVFTNASWELELMCVIEDCFWNHTSRIRTAADPVSSHKLDSAQSLITSRCNWANMSMTSLDADSKQRVLMRSTMLNSIMFWDTTLATTSQYEQLPLLHKHFDMCVVWLNTFKQQI